MNIFLLRRIKKIKYIVFLLIFTASTFSFAQQELKICALRVSFQVDQNPLTTGDGTFMMDTSGIAPYTIDPPPHNKSYFQDQILAVNNYFWQASRGNLFITGKVFPEGANVSYQLANEMSYYNPNTNEDENNRRLAQLLIDAVKLADNDPAIDFSQFDVVAVFHAGVGKDIDVGFDDTPQDIPSLYLSMDFFKEALGDTFSGIKVDNGNVIIENGIILPETESQSDIQIGLTGIFASNIGSHLGMLDLFSPSEQVTGIGRFGLMDVGQFNIYGLLPAVPCAYSRLSVNWESAELVNTPQTAININRFNGEATTGKSIIKIPVNSDEYYLLEYRGDRKINIDSVYFELAADRTEELTYLEVLQTYLPDKIQVSDSTGVLLNVEDYDWGLPGAGILIWHIDEKVIAEKKHINRINDDPENRGVDLEEADGSQDIGFTYSITEPGYQSELGTWLDFWFRDNTDSPLYKNEFSPTSSPNTRSNRNYADSHIILNNFSNNFGDIMTFDFARDFFEEGFPISLDNTKQSKEYTSLKGGQVSPGGRIIFTSDDLGNIFAVGASGKGVFSDSIYLFAQYSVQTKTNLALADTDGDGFDDVLIASAQSGHINGFKFRDDDNNLLADTLFTRNIGEQIPFGPVIQDTSFFVATANNQILQFGINGNLVQSRNMQSGISSFVVKSGINDILHTSDGVFGALVADLNSEGDFEFISFPDSSTINIEQENGNNVYPVVSNMTKMPSIADIDFDGYYEILYHSNKSINGMNFNGSAITGLPIQPGLQTDEKLIGTPMVADINNDGHNEIISVSNLGQLFGYNLSGESIDGFPTTAGDNVEISPILVDLDDDGKLELFVLNKKGDLHAWQIDSDFSDDNLWWTQENYSSDNNLFIERRLTPVGFGIDELLPSSRAYNYPNPNRENHTYIRYYLSEQSKVNIKIFDLAGDIVDSFSGPESARIDHQIKWDISNISSGIYLCRIEAKSESRSDVKIIKIMVVH